MTDTLPALSPDSAALWRRLLGAAHDGRAMVAWYDLKTAVGSAKRTSAAINDLVLLGYVQQVRYSAARDGVLGFTLNAEKSEAAGILPRGR